MDLVYQDVSQISLLDQNMKVARTQLDQAIIQREKNYILYKQAQEKIQAERYTDAFFNQDGSVNFGAVTNPGATLGYTFLYNQTRRYDRCASGGLCENDDSLL